LIVPPEGANLDLPFILQLFNSREFGRFRQRQLPGLASRP